MKKFTITMLFLFVATTLFAQADLKKGSHPISQSADNAYLYAEWLPATVALKDGGSSSVEARYNAVKQEMEINQGGDKFVLSPKQTKKVVITNIAFIPSGKGFSFYQLVEDTPQFTFVKDFKKVNGKLVSKLYKKNKKTGKMIPFKKEGLKKNPFVLDLKQATKTKKEENSSLHKNIYSSLGKTELVSKNTSGEGGVFAFDNREVKIEGSPYLNNNFSLGSVILKNKNKKITGFMNFQLVLNEFHLKYNNDTLKLDPIAIKKIILNEKIFIPITDINLDTTYYQSLGRINNQEVLVKYVVIISDSPYSPGISFGDPKKRVTKKDYLLISNDLTGAISPLKKNKKTLLALFGNKKKQMEYYIKQNHINIKDSESLSKLIKYYHTL